VPTSGKILGEGQLGGLAICGLMSGVQDMLQLVGDEVLEFVECRA
jgi:hypothetical protein